MVSPPSNIFQDLTHVLCIVESVAEPLRMRNSLPGVYSYDFADLPLCDDCRTFVYKPITVLIIKNLQST